MPKVNIIQLLGAIQAFAVRNTCASEALDILWADSLNRLRADLKTLGIEQVFDWEIPK